MDKTMTDKLVNIPNDDTQNYPFRRLKLVVEETFGQSTIRNQPKINKSSPGCLANE